MKRFIFAVALWLLPFAAYAACPTTSLQFKDANGIVQTLCFGGTGGAYIPQYQILDSGGLNALSINGSGQLTISNSSFASTQSGTWNVGLSAGGNTVGKFDILGNTGAILDFAGQNASSPPNAVLVGAQFNTSPSTITSGNVSPIQVDNGGRLIVNCTSGCGGSGGTSIADEAPFTQGSTSLTLGGGYFSSSPVNLTTGQAGTFRLTNTRHLMMDLEDVGGTAFALGQTTMGSSLPVVVASNQSNINVAVASALPAGGNTIGAVTQASAPWSDNVTQIGGSSLALGQTTMASSIPVAIASNQGAVPASQSGNWSVRVQDGSGNLINSTSNNLNVQCANCSGSGVSTGDEASFTAGVSLFAGGGGFFQTTATNNALTNGQQGMFQLTANRAIFTNLRNSSGTEVGTAGAPLQVSLANTSTNVTAVKVDGSGVTQPVSGAVTANAGTNLNTSALALDTSVNGLQVSQASTTSGQKGGLVLGAVTTNAPSYTTAQTDPLSLDTSGLLRVSLKDTPANTNNLNVALGAALPAGTNILGKVGIDQTTDVTTNGVEIAPTSSTNAGITAVVSTSAENNHVLKASAGNLYNVYATNLTNTAGFLVVLNATSSPVDGAITPLACAPLPGNSNSSISYNPGPPQIYSTGIVAVVTSATTCFTKTTGTITAFISGQVK